MAGQSFQLVVRAGPTPGKVYPIMKKEIIIGRDPNSDVLINDAEISRHHATIKFLPEGFVIEDLGSTNGTVINGQRLMGPHVLHPGEIINLGEHISLVFDRQVSFDPDATMVSPVSAAPPSPIKAHPPVYSTPAPKTYTQFEEDDTGNSNQIPSKTAAYPNSCGSLAHCLCLHRCALVYRFQFPLVQCDAFPACLCGWLMLSSRSIQQEANNLHRVRNNDHFSSSP